MTTELGESYCGWPHKERLGQEDSQDAAATPMLDQGSISFGRYAVEYLAWEKRSVFNHNRCQEELEKLKAPGLVAQKKAYFEAYYKRLRELKALQASDQTELVVEYGGDDNSSCQNGGAEDNLRNGVVTNVAADCLKLCSAVAVPVYPDQKVHVTCSNCSTSISKVDSSTRVCLDDDMFPECAGTFAASTSSFKEMHKINDSTNSSQYGKFDPHSAALYDDLQNMIAVDAGLRKQSNRSVQVVNMPFDSTLLDSPRRIEEIELLKGLCSDDDDDGDDEWNIKQSQDTQKSTHDLADADLDHPDNLMSKTISKFSPSYNHGASELKAPSTKHINHSAAPRIMESVSSIMEGKNAMDKTKPEVLKAPKIPKRFTQMTSIVTEKKIIACNAPSGRLPSKKESSSDTSYRGHKADSSLSVVKKVKSAHFSNAQSVAAPRINKSASVSSSRPRNESTPNVAIKVSSSAAQGLSTSHGTRTREIVPQASYSKQSSGSVQATKSLTMKNSSVVKHISGGVKNASLGNRSHHGDRPKTLSVLGSRTTGRNAEDGSLQRPETRTSKLHAVSQRNLTSKYCSEFKGGGQKEETPNARLRAFCGTSKLARAPAPPSRTHGTNTGKVVSVLLDGRKSRGETKPWR